MEKGAQMEMRYIVQQQDLASAVGVGPEDVFPEVLATSRMIGLMEVTAARLLQSLLQPGELSVGVGLEIKHFAPTPLDEELRIVATFDRLEGKLYLLEVEVYDRAGKVGSGWHSRAIINGDRLMSGAQSRMAKAASESP